MCSLFLVAMLEAITQEKKHHQRLTRGEVPVEGLGRTLGRRLVPPTSQCGTGWLNALKFAEVFGHLLQFARLVRPEMYS